MAETQESISQDNDMFDM